MLSTESLQAYRRMTPAERLRLTLDITSENERFLMMGTDEQVTRKFDLLNLRNDQRNRATWEALKRADQTQRRQHDGESSMP